MDPWDPSEQSITRRPRPIQYPSFTTLVVILAHEAADFLLEQVHNVLEYIPNCFIVINWNSTDPIDETTFPDRVEIHDVNMKVQRFSRTFVDAATYWPLAHPDISYQSVLFLSSTTLFFEPVPDYYFTGQVVAMGMYQQPDSIMDCINKHPMYMHLHYQYNPKHIFWWLPTRIPFYQKFMEDHQIQMVSRGQFSGSIYPKEIVMEVGQWLTANPTIPALKSPTEEILFQTIAAKYARRYMITQPIVYIHWTNVVTTPGKYECQTAETFEYAYRLAYGICRIDPGEKGEIARKMLKYRWIWRHLPAELRQSIDITEYRKYKMDLRQLMDDQPEIVHNDITFYRWIGEYPYYINEDAKEVISCIHPPNIIDGSYL